LQAPAALHDQRAGMVDPRRESGEPVVRSGRGTWWAQGQVSFAGMGAGWRLDPAMSAPAPWRADRCSVGTSTARLPLKSTQTGRSSAATERRDPPWHGSHGEHERMEAWALAESGTATRTVVGYGSRR